MNICSFRGIGPNYQLLQEDSVLRILATFMPSNSRHPSQPHDSTLGYPAALTAFYLGKRRQYGLELLSKKENAAHVERYIKRQTPVEG
jgi:hypothetical protein